MPNETPKPPRKPRVPRMPRNYEGEMQVARECNVALLKDKERLIMHAKLSIEILAGLPLPPSGGPDNFSAGQIAALRGVLKLLGETE